MKRIWLMIAAALLILVIAGGFGYRYFVLHKSFGPNALQPQSSAVPGVAGGGSASVSPEAEPDQSVPQGSDLSPDDFKLAGFRPFDQRTDVEKALGRPEKVETTNNGWLLETLYYNDVNMTFYLGGAVSITATSPKYPSARGIRVGDPVEKVFQAYGSNYTTWKGGPDGTITYSRDENSAITFDVKQNKITGITSINYPAD